MLLGTRGYYVDIGAGNGEGEPCASNTAYLEEIGWTGLLIDYNVKYMAEAATLRPRSICQQGDAFDMDFKRVFENNFVPNVIDYLTVDIDPSPLYQSPCTKVIERFPFEKYDFKILTIEHDLYNPHGKYQKSVLTNMMREKPYKMIVENVGLVYNGRKYLEDWFINPKYFKDFQIPNIESLFYSNINPNDIILDLAKRKYEGSVLRP